MFEMFISYPGSREDIAGNLKSRLADVGVTAWIYSEDRLAAEDTWVEIRERIGESRLFAFLISRKSKESSGQTEELRVALERISQENSKFDIFPILLDDDATFPSLPEPLQRKNGFRLHGGTVKTIAFQIARQFFPETVDKWTNDTR